ncbi:E3 ubiquitin-protein ligase MBR2-like [Iris pallida]|uniref:RING-type E3 ubiquitin transferase n=1 Tax=Iris pallida TaxID=29817 RepID=A0AAX6HFJ7_IRIPA|nr:E3 ubiquitin-protein ligase MBR2-like [Iris pallida]KAJ6839502.1 E3 ubiquitin-protein ligase MBR2-like [Iris pallida]
MSSFFRSSHDSESPLISSSSSSNKREKKKKSGFASAALRGLGCASSASSEAYAPPPSAAASSVRSSADSQDQQQGWRSSRGRARPPPIIHHHNRKTNSRNNNQRAAMAAAVDAADDDDEDDDEEDSFDCFMGRHHPMIMHHRTGRYDAERFHREMMKLQTRMSGGLLIYDRYRDLQLDVDRMSYEELLELGDRIGHVSTGLREDEISQSLMEMKHSVFDSSQPDISTEMERKCSICQEEYKVDEDMGKLECGHSYHMYCIKQWLFQKNSCPVCKTSVTKT